MKDLSSSFFNLTTPKLPLTRGSLFIAQPFLSEDWFERAVISLIDYDRKEGATGLVLNNSTKSSLRDVLDASGDCGAKVPLYCGGPLSHDRLFYIHTLGPDIIPESSLYAPGLYIGGDLDSALSYVRDGYPTEGCIRFFIGYSGWSRGQLEEEMMANTWASVEGVLPADTLLVGHGDSYWQRIVRSMGDAYKSWRLIPREVISN